MNKVSIPAIAALVGIQIGLVVRAAHAAIVPAPEPSSLTLLGAGAAVVAIGAWWRNRK